MAVNYQRPVYSGRGVGWHLQLGRRENERTESRDVEHGFWFSWSLYFYSYCHFYFISFVFFLSLYHKSYCFYQILKFPVFHS